MCQYFIKLFQRTSYPISSIIFAVDRTVGGFNDILTYTYK